ncbi:MULTISPECIES: heavy-metal-associated domain-containing protein [Flavobacterium]|jgi:copper chaperone|uniref:Copper chaperone n=1 Tax=Flavobacterium caseinilyticum TaxID=2541732 RepID=A0A4R5ATB4_9FLAO|nr:heavy-metal-associated domain-containing protein [Flavobacterium caseinilyticum]TDD74344.1 copper chaperone [Flavobacterium caseinilyticum]
MENNNQNLQFKTNINCGGCVAKVTPFLNDAEGVCHWEVDTNNKDKVLTVKSEGITQEQVIETVQKAGFKIEPLSKD